ncbi:hypothetical protein QYF61_027743 [Mycteria americana]|uniref:Uncharacterized protein n=1 Tax=Mycteria americana TaxID=33587 RepID=A0AAN7NZ24_MYCAM|nr:hypothetical protein QYF61_027743 [Mycteria americana]
MGDPHWRSLFLKDCTLWKGPMLEQFVKKCREGLTLEKFLEDCVPMVGPHAGAEEECEEGGVAETTHIPSKKPNLQKMQRFNGEQMLKNHRIIEWFGLERTFTGHLVQPPCNEQGHLQLDQVAQSPVQSEFVDEAATTPLGNLCQCFTTLIIKNFFLISILEGCNKVFPEPSPLQAEQPQLSQPFFVGVVFHPSEIFHGPLLDPLQQVHVFPVLKVPELDAVLQVRSHQSGLERQNHIPGPAGHASFDAAQHTVGILGCKHTLPAHVQLFVHQAALNPFIPQPLLKLRIALTQVQDPALGLVEPHEVHMGPLLQLVQVLLGVILSIRHLNRTTQLGVICKLAEGALDPTVYVNDEDIKQYWSQYGPLRDTTCHQSPSGH